MSYSSVAYFENHSYQTHLFILIGKALGGIHLSTYR